MSICYYQGAWLGIAFDTYREMEISGVGKKLLSFHPAPFLPILYQGADAHRMRQQGDPLLLLIPSTVAAGSVTPVSVHS